MENNEWGKVYNPGININQEQAKVNGAKMTASGKESDGLNLGSFDYAAGIGSALTAASQYGNQAEFGTAKGELASIRDTGSIVAEKGLSAAANVASGNYIGAAIDVGTGLYETIDGKKRKKELQTKIKGEDNIADAEEATDNIVSTRQERASFTDKPMTSQEAFGKLDNIYGKDFNRYNRSVNGYRK